MEEDYKSWEDLLNEEDQADAIPSETVLSDQDLSYLKNQVDLPEDVNALFDKQTELENKLKKLTGQGEPDPEEERIKLMYPIKVHTKESRLEDRQQKKEEEKKHFQKIKALEKKIAQRKAEERNNEKRKDAVRDLKNKQQLHQKWEQKKKENEDSFRTTLIENQRLQEKYDQQIMLAVSKKRERDQEKTRQLQKTIAKQEQIKQEKLNLKKRQKAEEEMYFNTKYERQSQKNKRSLQQKKDQLMVFNERRNALHRTKNYHRRKGDDMSI